MSGLSRKDKLEMKRAQQAAHKEKRKQEMASQPVEEKYNWNEHNRRVNMMFGAAKPAKTNLVIERYAAGVILGVNEFGNLRGVRCYHYFNGRVCPCDCLPDDKGWFTLSRESQVAMAKGKLSFNEDKLNQQKELVANGITDNPVWFKPNSS